MRKTLPFLFMFLGVVQGLKAQTTIAPETSALYFNINFNLGVPIGEYKTYNDEIAPGGGFDILFQPHVKVPLLVGFNMAFMSGGSQIQRETLTADIVAGNTVIETLYFPMRVETYNTIIGGNVSLRVQAPTNFVKPYVEGLVGFNYFGTNTSVYDESEEFYLSEADNPLITSSNQNSDWTYSFGGAAGMLIQINESIFIDVRAAYRLGGNAQYYVEDDIEDWELVFNTVPTEPDDFEDDDLSISAIPKESKTDMIVGTIGLTFKF